MNTIFVKVTGELVIGDHNVLTNNKGLDVVAKLDLYLDNNINAIYVDSNDMKCVKTGAVIEMEDGKLSVDIFMYPADLYVHDDTHRGYFIKADNLKLNRY